VVPRQPIHACQGRVGGTVDIDRIRFKTKLVTRYGERLYFVDQHERCPVHGKFRDRLLKEFGDSLLAAAEGRTRKSVWINLDVCAFRAGKLLRDLVGQAAAQSCLAGSRCAF
jgi:hypothetical protein